MPRCVCARILVCRGVCVPGCMLACMHMCRDACVLGCVCVGYVCTRNGFAHLLMGADMVTAVRGTPGVGLTRGVLISYSLGCNFVHYLFTISEMLWGITMVLEKAG